MIHNTALVSNHVGRNKFPEATLMYSTQNFCHEAMAVKFNLVYSLIYRDKVRLYPEKMSAVFLDLYKPFWCALRSSPFRMNYDITIT
jgi:hypothetical protein